jgi:Holliday junction resolvase RusA-like endonuclease
VPEFPLRCRVAGWPKTKGHKTAGVRGDGTAFMREAGKHLKPWMANLTDGLKEMMAAAGAEPLDVPVFLRVTFFIPRMKGKTDLEYPTAQAGPYSGDLDTLERSVGDAGTAAGVWTDDSLIVGAMSWKRWAPEGEPGGAQIQVWPASMIDRKG